MKEFNLFLALKDLVKRNHFFSSYELFIPVLGLIPLTYVLYAGFFDLPPNLTKVTVFASIFIGLSLVLHWRENYSIAPLLLVYLGLFFLPLTWLWRGLEFDDNVLMGIFPFNDGMYYLVDAYRLLAGLDNMIMYNGRPLYSGLLSFFMWISGGNLQIALALFCACAVLSIFLLALEIRQLAGPLAAAMTSTILFYFSLPFLGRVNTENLGLTLGTLALVLILRGARKNSLTTLSIGAFTLSMALNARAGAFFALPFLVYWSWIKRGTFGRKAPLILIGAISIGFMVNTYLINSLGLKDKDTFSNFGHSLFGLASGYKGWAHVYTVYPELENTSNVLPLALELIRKNPLMLIWGILLNYKDYFSPYGMFYLMNFGDQQSWISWILYLVTIVGAYRLIKSRRETHWSVILFVATGILLSLAVIPHNDNGLRVLMATNPITALVTGLAFLPVQNKPKKEFWNIRTMLLGVYAAILGISCALGPFVVVAFSRAVGSPLPILDCPNGTEQISVIVTRGSYINVVRDGPTFGFLPEVKRSDIKTRLDAYYSQGHVPFDVLLNFPALERLVRNLRPGDTILMGLNLAELKVADGPDEFIFLITRTNQIHQIGDVNHFCARLAADDRLRGNRFYFDQSIEMNE